jgi:hypothetical protein
MRDILFQEADQYSEDLTQVQKVHKFLCFLKLFQNYHGHCPGQSAYPVESTHMFTMWKVGVSICYSHIPLDGGKSHETLMTNSQQVIQKTEYS